MKIGDQGLVIGARTPEGRKELVGKVVTIIGQTLIGVPWFSDNKRQVYFCATEECWVVQGNFSFSGYNSLGEKFGLQNECMLYKRHVMPLQDPDKKFEKEEDKLLEGIE